MLYDENVTHLQEAVERHRFIRNIRYHRLPDGTLDYAGNRKVWERATEDLIKTPLGPTGAWFAFVPVETGAERTEEIRKRGTILIAHGGGFNWRTGCEAGNAAWYFHRRGFNTAILSYRLQPVPRIDSMRDMQQAIRLLRIRQDEFGISDRIAVMGFSAGGMLAGNCATHFGEEVTDSGLSDRPDAVVIGYGAMSCVSFHRPFPAADYSAAELAFCGRTEEERYYLAPEKNIRPDTPPMFIWQTLSEPGAFGMTLAKSLEDAKVPYELHIFSEGSHGICLADGENDLGENNPHVAHWAELCAEWLHRQNI